MARSRNVSSLTPGWRFFTWLPPFLALFYPPSTQAGFGQVYLGDAQASFRGEGDNEEAGWSVSFAGDFNADGYDDLLIGAQLNDHGAEDAGKVYLLFGRPAGLSGHYDLGDAEGGFIGEKSEDYAGSALAGVGDVDGDGYDDFVIGAWGNDQAGGAAGKSYLIYGGSSIPGEVRLSSIKATFTGESPGDVAGYALARAGDVNGDGYADLLLGAPHNDAGGNNSGRAYLWLGGPSRPTANLSLRSAPVILQGDKTNDRFGFALDGGLDVDRDGRSDLLVGAHESDLAGNNSGAAYLFAGSSLASGLVQASSARLIVAGAEAGDQLGYSVALSEDVDGDGLGELFLGAYRASRYTPGAGAGVLISSDAVSGDGVVSAATGVVFDGDGTYDGAGQTVAAPGDIDLDGLGDLLLAAPSADLDGDPDVGRVAFIPGAQASEGGFLSDCPDLFLGSQPSALAGFAVRGRGDVDGDRRPDLLIGAFGAGHAYLILSGLYFDDDGDGTSEFQGDCDDGDPGSLPGSLEIPYDGIDQDCDGEDSADLDGDGFLALEAGGADCDDADPTITPVAVELPDGVDQDCDGRIDEETVAGDDDGDGYSELEGDCRDTDASIHPEAAELPDGKDQDCDDRIDEGLPSTDDDGDGLSELDGDCDDENGAVFPGALETLDGMDQDCDGSVYEVRSPGDQDGDGFTTAQGDPDDADPTTFPGAPERPDGIDNDGDGVIDEGTSDLDGDGYSEAEGDTDDEDGATFPGAPELPDGIDNDGDGEVDEGASDLDGDGYTTEQGDPDDADPTTFPGAPELPDGVDNDGDGHVDEATVDLDGDGFTSEQGDADDGDPTTFPGAPELPDGIDNDGDGVIDEGTSDLDGDGYSPLEGDCDDSDGSIHPQAPETIDSRDEDCDDLTDEGTQVYDDDGDGYSELDDDCGDGDPARHPGAQERCNGVDDDCDGRTDEGCTGNSGDDDDTPLSGDDEGSSGDDDDSSGDDDDDSGSGDGGSGPGDDDDDSSSIGDDDDDSTGGDDDETPPEYGDATPVTVVIPDYETGPDEEEVYGVKGAESGARDTLPPEELRGRPFQSGLGCHCDSGDGNRPADAILIAVLMFLRIRLRARAAASR